MEEALQTILRLSRQRKNFRENRIDYIIKKGEDDDNNHEAS